MHSAVTLRLGLTACGIILSLGSCNRPKAEGAGDTGVVSMDSSGERAAGATVKGKVPLSTKSEDARKLYDEGVARFDQVRFHDARQKFIQAEAKDPEFAMAHYQLAITSTSTNDAQEHLKQAVALADKATEGERLQIQALQAAFNGDPAKSLEYTRQASEKYPDDERLHTFLAFSYSGQQDNDKAIGELNKAIELNPDYSAAYNALGYAYRNQNKNDEAEKAFKKYIELVPNDPNPYDSYAELLLKTGRFDESIAQYRKALSIDPHFIGSHFGIVGNLVYQGKHDQAIAESQKLEKASRNDGERRTARFARALVYADQGKTDLAVKELEKEYAIAAKAGDNAQMAGDVENMGFVLLNAGRTDQAAKRFQQALDMVANSTLPAEAKEDLGLGHRYDMARLALAKGDLAAAKAEAEAYQKGAEAKDNELRIKQAHELNGTIAIKEKDYDKATGELEKASQQDPYVTYLLATAYEGKGDKAKAGELYQEAAQAYILPTFNYVLIRSKAKQRVIAQPTS
jgi:tetratricopeptide (TPR) repeat protein